MRLLCSLLLLSLLIVGCGTPKWVQSVNSYTLTAPALDQASAAYTQANDIHIMQEESVLVSEYATQGYHPGVLTKFISDSNLQSRLEAIKVLKDYTSLVYSLANGSREREIDTKSKSLIMDTGKAVNTDTASQTHTDVTTESNAVKVNSTLTDTTTQTSTSTLTNSHSTVMTPQQMSYIFSGMDTALKPLINHLVKRKLLTLMKAADPTVQTLCTLLEEDMETLRIQSKSDYQVLLVKQSEFINKNHFDPVEKRNEILKLFQIEADEDKAQSEYNSTIIGLKRLAEAHHRVVIGETFGENHESKHESK